MPAKELANLCVDCGDAEFVVDVRSRRLCKYVAFLHPAGRQLLTLILLEIGRALNDM